MIKKLEKKISFIIILALSIITIGVICIFTISNYKNTIETSVNFMNRFLKVMPEKNNENNNQPENMQSNNEPEIDGVYRILVSDQNTIINSNQELTDEVKDIAIEASNKYFMSGTIGDYVYKIDKGKNNEEELNNSTRVMLIYNKDVVTRLHKIIITNIILIIILEIIIYIVAIKISKWIVRPVEETFNKQKEFISDASHELKTPLAVIEANTEVLENNIGTNKWLVYIQNEIESMNKLISELLLLAKMENIDSIETTEKFNISQESEIILSMFESMAYEKKIKLESDIEENISFNGRKEDIEHILSTLIDNAIKHTNTKVKVELRKEKDKLVFNVSNEGEEIPLEERSKIFERFYRINKSRNRNEKRYGLGLAIAKSVVEKYNGEIKVNCKDGITTFTVKLPY